jgi:hypothetical protein
VVVVVVVVVRAGPLGLLDILVDVGLRGLPDAEPEHVRQFEELGELHVVHARRHHVVEADPIRVIDHQTTPSTEKKKKKSKKKRSTSQVLYMGFLFVWFSLAGFLSFGFPAKFSFVFSRKNVSNLGLCLSS